MEKLESAEASFGMASADFFVECMPYNVIAGKIEVW